MQLPEMHGERLERVLLLGSHARGDAGEDSDCPLPVGSEDRRSTTRRPRCAPSRRRGDHLPSGFHFLCGALAVSDATRSQALPDVPTVGESVPGFEAAIWYGVGAPRNTPAEIVDTLNKVINAGRGDVNLKTHLADLGGTVIPGSPADFGRLIATETEKWGKVVKFSGARPD